MPHPFELPVGCTSPRIQLHFGPAAVDGIRNRLTLTLFDPAGFCGAGHRSGDEHVMYTDSKIGLTQNRRAADATCAGSLEVLR